MSSLAKPSGIIIIKDLVKWRPLGLQRLGEPISKACRLQSKFSSRVNKPDWIWKTPTICYQSPPEVLGLKHQKMALLYADLRPQMSRHRRARNSHYPSRKYLTQYRG